MELTDKLLKQFDKYPDPMEVMHMADLLGCEPYKVYYTVANHPGDIPHLRIGRKIIFPKAQVVPWWSGPQLVRKVI